MKPRLPSLDISFSWKLFLVRVILPTVLTVVLFLSATFFLLIPTIEENSLDRKREMIRELTNSAWNILAKLEHDQQLGLITREQAQQRAVDQIRNLHYGQEMKDYFWINDMHPHVVIHPYRSDLNGKDVSNYTDPDGKYVFREMVDVVKQNGSGYVYYKWQSRDNKYHIVPKISYVKGFTPWGWIIGTGIYIEDITAEIASITQNVIYFSLGILLFISLMLASIISVSYKAHQQQKKAEKELAKTQKSLALAEKMASLGQLSAMVAHEINNPLSGILSYAKLSARYLGREPVEASTLAELKENLALIASEAKRCGDIVKNLLLFAKRSLGEVSEVHLNEVINVSTKVIDHSAKMKDIELVAELDIGDDAVRCDAGAVQQILVSLIVNAIEASEQGNKIVVKTDYHDNNQVTIKLIDHGEGIPQQVLPHIFDPFFSTKESNKSLGLGLSAVYGIVQRHAGAIHVESKVGQGTEFTITLPRTQKRETPRVH
ncbi:MAG: GHKL domain-containing protein [Deltaproteobacteria bacterium]|nr:GHKL domain-containing protein [Deltaproteobacteria bacterium]